MHQPHHQLYTTTIHPTFQPTITVLFRQLLFQIFQAPWHQPCNHLMSKYVQIYQYLHTYVYRMYIHRIYYIHDIHILSYIVYITYIYCIHTNIHNFYRQMEPPRTGIPTQPAPLKPNASGGCAASLLLQARNVFCSVNKYYADSLVADRELLR